MVNQKYLDKAETLIEALPYIQRFNRKIVVGNQPLGKQGRNGAAFRQWSSCDRQGYDGDCGNGSCKSK